MNTENTKKMNWGPCTSCYGQGRVIREPSKKRLRAYEAELELFKSNQDTTNPPKLPRKNTDVCPRCVGTGLSAQESLMTPDTRYPHLAIVGGGIGGVALAAACLHRGIPFDLYERDSSFDARPQGYGLTLQQASKAIQGLGLHELGDTMNSTRHVVHQHDGKIIGEWGLRRWNVVPNKESLRRKNLHVPRQSLRSAILRELEGCESIRWGHSLVDVSLNKKGSYDLQFQVAGEMKTTQADLVVGADGIWSAVRRILADDEKSPLKYLDCMVILGICPIGRLSETKSPLFDQATVFQSVNGHERIYVMPFEAQRVMWQLSFPTSESEARELSKKGGKAMQEEALKRLGNWHSPIPEILTETDESYITGYPVYDRELLIADLFENFESATLIGDAAHPMSPFKGQGANQAILDALSLARSIAKKCGPDSEWREKGLRDTVLRDFEREMIARSSSKVKGSRDAARLLHTDAVLHDGDEPRGRGLKVQN